METAHELAAFLKVKLPTIRKWTQQGLPHLKLGKRAVRYQRDAVLDWLTKRREK